MLDSRALENLDAIKARAEARLGRGLPPELASLTLTPGDIDAAEEAWFEANAHGVLRYRRAGLEAEAEEEDDTVVPGGAINPVALGTKDEGD